MLAFEDDPEVFPLPEEAPLVEDPPLPAVDPFPEPPEAVEPFAPGSTAETEEPGIDNAVLPPAETFPVYDPPASSPVPLPPGIITVFDDDDVGLLCDDEV